MFIATSIFVTLSYLFMAMQYPVDSAWIGYSRGPQIRNGPWVATQHWKNDIYGSDIGTWDNDQPSGSTTDQNNYCAIHMHNISITSPEWTLRDTRCTDQMGVVCYTSSYSNSSFQT